MTMIEEKISIDSLFLNRLVIVSLFIPTGDDSGGPINLLLLNDGQEAENLLLGQTLTDLYQRDKIPPTLVAAVHAGIERIQEYGVANQPDFKGRGSKADLYTQFIMGELLPYLYSITKTGSFAVTAFAGFSLGGLSAIDIAWNNSNVFSKTGVMSGSFWWRSRALNDGYCDNDRIMHRVICESKDKPSLKFWLQTGTLDEIADRNNNGIIDAIDDTVDLIRELEAKGYQRPADITYLEMVGGKHNSATWAQAMPRFLTWAFGNL